MSPQEVTVRKHKHDFKELSNERCQDCPRRIKLNVAERIKHRPLKCYAHHQAGIEKKRVRR